MMSRLFQRLDRTQVGDWPEFPGQFPEQCRILRVTRPFIRGPDVLAVQRALRERGYTPGPEDGVYGGLTRLAVQALKQDQKLGGAEGVVNKEVYRVLNIPCRRLIQPDPQQLVYNDPYAQGTALVLYGGRPVLAVSLGRIRVDPKLISWSTEYIPIYGQKNGEPVPVPGQLPIVDSVPGDPDYSPIRRYHYVIVPEGYVPGTFGSAEEVEKSGYSIIETDILNN